MIKQRGWQMHNNLGKTYSEILKYCFDVRRSKKVSISRSQIDLGKRGEQDNPNDGGVGYNDKYNH